MVSAIVLAAGLSTRMQGKNKLLLPFDGKTVLQAVVENITNSNVQEIIVVTGDNLNAFQHTLSEPRISIVNNPQFRNGMTTSIQKGVSMATGAGYMICLGDMPFITAGEYSQLAIFFERQMQFEDSCICVPEYNNHKGNPVIFSSYHREAILRHDNMDGCKAILSKNAQSIYTINMLSDNILRDIDTPSDYQKSLSGT